MDTRQQKQLISQYEKWIYKQANKLNGICDSIMFDDLVSIGQFAIFEAIDGYKEEGAATLSSHIMNTIKWRMLSALRSGYHYGASQYNKILTINKYKKIVERNIFEKEGINRPATSQEICVEMKKAGLADANQLSVEQIDTYTEIANMRHKSVDVPFSEDKKLFLQIDAEVDVEDDVDKILQKELLDKALSLLTPKEEKVIRMRFYQDKTLEEVGVHFSLTRERIRQIQQKALRKLPFNIEKIKAKPEIIRPNTNLSENIVHNKVHSNKTPLRNVYNFTPAEDYMEPIKSDTHDINIEIYDYKLGIHPHEFEHLSCASFKILQVLKLGAVTNKSKLAKAAGVATKTMYNSLEVLRAHNMVGAAGGYLWANPAKYWKSVAEEEFVQPQSVVDEPTEEARITKQQHERLKASNQKLRLELDVLKKTNQKLELEMLKKPAAKIVQPRPKHKPKERVKVYVIGDHVRTPFGVGTISEIIDDRFDVALSNGKHVIAKPSECVRY